MRAFVPLWALSIVTMVAVELLSDFWYSYSFLFWVAAIILIGWGGRVGYVLFFEGDKENVLRFLNGETFSLPPVETEDDVEPGAQPLPRDVIAAVTSAFRNLPGPTRAQITTSILRLFRLSFPPAIGDAPFITPLYDAMPNVAYVINQLTYEFAEAVGETTPTGQTGKAWGAYLSNLTSVSARLPAASFNAGKRIFPNEYVGTSAELVRTYLTGTPFLKVFRRDVPYTIPDDRRFEHEWIIATSGQGKSTLLEAQIAYDLKRVMAGECSVVVIDSQNRLFKRVRELRLFAPGQPLYGKLTVIEPEPENYVPLNPFGIGRERLAKYTQRDQDQLTNAAIELLTYVFTDLSEAGITSKQVGLFRYCCRLMMAMPKADITTLIDLLKTGLDGPRNYRQYLPLLDQVEPDGSIDDFERKFFETSFLNEKEYKDTKTQVVRRLELMLESRELRRMFTDTRPSYDLFTELAQGRVVLINTDKALLGSEATEVFGRLFIALILRATQERATVSTNVPTFVYIDEAWEYIAKDEKINEILIEARKQKVGLILAHTKLADITSDRVRAALADVACRFAGGNESDAAILAKTLHVWGQDAAYMARVPQGQFACWIRGRTDYAISVRAPGVVLDTIPKMNNGELARVRGDQRQRFARRPDPDAPPTSPGDGEPPPPPPLPPPLDKPFASRRL